MAHRPFEDLPVWQTAFELALRIYDLVRTDALTGHSGMRDQLERAVISISNNIAEGYERGTHAELLTFLYYAKGSAGEVRSMLRIMNAGEDWRAWQGETAELIRLAESASRQLWAWLNVLRDSESKGPRYSTQETRREDAEALRRARFDAYLKDVQDAAKEGRKLPPFDS